MDKNATCCEIGATHIHLEIARRSNIILDDCLRYLALRSIFAFVNFNVLAAMPNGASFSRNNLGEKRGACFLSLDIINDLRKEMLFINFVHHA